MRDSRNVRDLGGGLPREPHPLFVLSGEYLRSNTALSAQRGRRCRLKALALPASPPPRRDRLYHRTFSRPCRLPLKKVFSFEPQEHHAYSQAHEAGHQGEDCAAMFAACSFSLIDLALGRYNALQTDRDPADYSAATFGSPNVDLVGDWLGYNMK